MSTRVTVTLPDEIYRRAEHIALQTGRPVAELLADAIVSRVAVLTEADASVPIEQLGDAEVLAAADLQMQPALAERFSDLLDKQQDGDLSEQERPELLGLLQIYQEGLVRKAEGLREAVRRGLRPPLTA